MYQVRQHLFLVSRPRHVGAPDQLKTLKWKLFRQWCRCTDGRDEGARSSAQVVRFRVSPNLRLSAKPCSKWP